MIIENATYYAQTEATKEIIRNILSDFKVSKLLKKKAFAGLYQKVEISEQGIKAIFKQKRMYPLIFKHKTNVTGGINVEFKDTENNTVSWEYEQLKYWVSWHYEEMPYRILIPNNILSEVLDFVAMSIQLELPFNSETDTQVIYYLDSITEAEQLTQQFPQIIIEEIDKKIK